VLLVDENLPLSLARQLGGQALHATELGDRLTDQQLWSRARVVGGMILTKDADFFDRLSLEGPPPQVVWVRLGNLRRQALEAIILARWPQIRALLEGASLVEIHPDRLEALSLGQELKE
jgi:predicted nuclease of predicted toxin-antitoxin system